MLHKNVFELPFLLLSLSVQNLFSFEWAAMIVNSELHRGNTPYTSNGAKGLGRGLTVVVL